MARIKVHSLHRIIQSERRFASHSRGPRRGCCRTRWPPRNMTIVAIMIKENHFTVLGKNASDPFLHRYCLTPNTRKSSSVPAKAISNVYGSFGTPLIQSLSS